MTGIKLLEYGYSLETGKHFIKFLISGLTSENEKKMMKVLSNIPEGTVKRFESEKTDEGVVILERFPDNQYPFHQEVPTPEEIKKVENMVEGFIKPFNK